MAAPWLSVLMPVHNGARYLRTALDSIVAQGADELAALEVIAVDDGSTDETPEIFRSYAGRLNLQLVSNDRNLGWTAATNLAMGLAAGAYQCWLHHDDVWSVGRARQLRSVVQRWPEANLFLHPSWFIDPAGRRIGLWRCPLPADRILDSSFVISRLLVQNFAATPATLYKSDVLSSVGMLDNRLWYNADWDFWLRIAERGTTVRCRQPLSGYRIHPESLTAQRTSDSAALRTQYDLILSRYDAGPAETQRLPGRVLRLARFSAEANIELARWAAGKNVGWTRLAARFARLGPRGWYCYLRDSRILERASSRLRVRARAAGQTGLPERRLA